MQANIKSGTLVKEIKGVSFVTVKLVNANTLCRELRIPLKERKHTDFMGRKNNELPRSN